MQNILAALLVAVLLALAWLILEFRRANSTKGQEPLAQLINQNILDTRSALDKNVDAMNQRLDGAREYIAKLANELVRMQTIGKNVEELRGIFMNSKTRGNFGEQVLNDMLANNFPAEQYELQHKFKGGETVDAAIKTKDGLIPIDSKFPLDSFRRMIAAESENDRQAERKEFQTAVKKHLNDIAKKYIMTGEGTTDFAVMYVPSEACYYEMISGSDELTDLAQKIRVMMVSPNTMSYFLYILRLGNERISIEKNVQKVWEMLAGFHQETMKFGEQMGVLSRHITNAKGAMDTAQAAYDKLAGKVDQIRQLK